VTTSDLELVRPDHHGWFVTLGTDSCGRATTVELRGELDIAAVCELRGLGRCLRAAPVLDIDLEAVDFMDSTGLHAVLDLRQALVDRGCDVRVLAPRTHELKVLTVAASLGWAPQELGVLSSQQRTAPEGAA